MILVHQVNAMIYAHKSISYLHMLIPTCPVAANLVTQLPWPQRLKDSLSLSNWFLIEQPRLPKRLPSANALWKVISSTKQLKQNHLHQEYQHPQGPYSEYVGVSSNVEVPNELVRCFPYLRHLEQSGSRLYEEELAYICGRIKGKDCLEQWNQLCRLYCPKLDLIELVRCYFRLLEEGTRFIVQMARSLACKPTVLLYTLQTMQKYICFRQVISPFAVSLEKGQLVTLETVSKTIKMLFCPICVQFDCSRHMVTDLVQKHNYSYMPSHKTELTIERKKTNIIRIYQHLVQIYAPRPIQPNQESFCSKHCYKSMDREYWQKYVARQKNSSYSRVFQVLLKMGIQIFNYDCCRIAKLVYPRTCQQVYYYLINCCNLINRLEHKFYSSQGQYLREEYVDDTVVRKAKNRRRKISTFALRSSAQKEKKSVLLKNEEKNGSVSNAVCFHYFCEGVVEDKECTSCCCRERGYCLPQCQCSQNCPIPLKGCKCRFKCSATSCPCRKANRACIPELCQHCFTPTQQNLDKICNNNELVFRKPKLLRVGKSTIPQAGLGLFAGQNITKDSFVIQYLGEIIEHDTLQKFRENLHEEGMFYNFQLTKNKSIDSRHYGNKARFMNHSQTRQNVLPIKMRIKQQDIMIFRALRDISRNEELLFNYNGSGGLSEFRDRYPFIK